MSLTSAAFTDGMFSVSASGVVSVLSWITRPVCAGRRHRPHLLVERQLGETLLRTPRGWSGSTGTATIAFAPAVDLTLDDRLIEDRRSDR